MRANALRVVGGVLAVAACAWGASHVVRLPQRGRGTVASLRVSHSRPGGSLSVSPRGMPTPLAPVSAPKMPSARRNESLVMRDGWATAPPAGRPVQAGSPRLAVPPRGLTVGRPGVMAPGARLPATATVPAAPPSRALTTTPPRPQAPVRPVGPVIRTGPLGFVEEAGTQSTPVLTMENADAATVFVSLSGPKTYRQAVPPGRIVQLEIEPGFYRAQVRSAKLGSVPNRGTGEFRAFRRYYARWQSVPYTQATPLRLGEQAIDQPSDHQATIPEGEQDSSAEPPVKPMPEEP